MSDDNDKSRIEVSPWHVLPALAAFVPVILAFATAEHSIGRAIFGGWNLLILIPAFYWITYLIVDRLTDNERE